MSLLFFFITMNTNTEVVKKAKSPFAKKESDSQPLPDPTPKPKFPLGLLEKNGQHKKQWLGKRTREDAFGEEEEDSDLEDAQDSDASDEVSDVDMDEAPLQEEWLESALSSVLKEFTTLKSIMFASMVLAMSQLSTSRKTPPTISLTSLQETERLLETVAKYLSDTSKSSSEQ